MTLMMIVLLVAAAAGDDSPMPSDAPASDGAAGFPSRAPGLDVLPGFAEPPPGYGQVPFYWWVGDKLTRERLLWQLDQLAPTKPSGLQVNYAHTDAGGFSYGLTMPSDPPLFSEAWWDLFTWWAGECNRRGIAVSLSDYTLGIVGQGYWMDEILRDEPGMTGRVLAHTAWKVPGGAEFAADVPENTVSVLAFRRGDGGLVADSALDLRPSLDGRRLSWHAPVGEWQVVAVHFSVNPHSVDPLHPKLGPMVVDKFFRRFEEHLPGQAGKGLNFFFSDELTFGVSGLLWTDAFAAEFRARKGYDVVPLLPGLFMDIGPQTPKVRLDYSDVMIQLSEVAYFIPVFRWHQERGMLYGCDHGGRGTAVAEFGDYFRTQRWMTGPGCDQPFLSDHVVKNKVASSIAHLYERPRVWLEGFHSSGWGTSTADLTRATFENCVSGQNLMSLHGLYYSLHGGWWEWAPPCNHFRMPYWAHMDVWMLWMRRLSYLMSQGAHRCDVAILYPVAPVEAGVDGDVAVKAAFECGNRLFGQGLDFDFIDFESLARSEIADRELRVAGEAYQALILPAMSVVRHSTMEQALRFFRAGGVVIALARLPDASDRVGRGDAELDAMVREVFGISAAEGRGGSVASLDGANAELRTDTAPRLVVPPSGGPSGDGARGFTSTPQRNAAGGVGLFLPAGPVPASNQAPVWLAPLLDVLNANLRRDFVPAAPCRVNHRRVGPHDVYLVTRAAKGAECVFRATGKAELWDPWTGKVAPLRVLSQDANGTRLGLPLDKVESQLIVFSPGVAEMEQSEAQQVTDDVMTLDGAWECELKPTMDNRWGDFRLPACDGLIGAEARRFRCAEETGAAIGWGRPDFDDSDWLQVTHGFGPMFLELGPVPADADATALDAQLAARPAVTAGVEECLGSKPLVWKPYEFSWRWGVEGDAGHQGWHGLKGEMYDHFIRIGKILQVKHSQVRSTDPAEGRYYLWTTVCARTAMQARIVTGGAKPAGVWVNGWELTERTETAELNAGSNTLLLRYDHGGEGYFLLVEPGFKMPESKPGSLSMRWDGAAGILPFDVRPATANPAGWYRFRTAPGTRAMTLTVRGRVRCWIDGSECQPSAANPGRSTVSESRLQAEVAGELERADPAPSADARQGNLRFEWSSENKAGAVVALRIEQERGWYGGAALPEPVTFESGPGELAAGDWSKQEGLASYSGGMWYRRTVTLPDAALDGRIILDLGNVVSSGEVHVNGRAAGVRVAPPWQWDITGLVQPGENWIEILVYNTLANHYLTIPTRYRGDLNSGLLGPVTLRCCGAGGMGG